MNDYLVHGLSADGSLRVISAITTNTVEEARNIHKTSAVATAALGRVLTGTKIISSMLKNDSDSITIQFKGNGPLGSITAVADAKDTIKGYVSNPNVNLPLNSQGKLDVGKALGRDGFLSIVRDSGMKEPYTGHIPLVTSEIAEDLASYFAISEQIPTAVALGVLIDTDGSVRASGGYIIQLMPDADENVAELVESLVKKAKPVTTYIDEGLNAEDFICDVLDGFMLFFKEQKPIHYNCDCTYERVEKAIISLGKNEIISIINDPGYAEATCHFCHKHYDFNKDKLTDILREI